MSINMKRFLVLITCFIIAFCVATFVQVVLFKNPMDWFRSIFMAICVTIGVAVGQTNFKNKKTR